MLACDGSSGVRRWLTLVTGLLECLCFAGAVFGWASLVFVLKTEDYFSSLCVNATGVNGTQVVGQCLFNLVPTPSGYGACVSQRDEFI